MTDPQRKATAALVIALLVGVIFWSRRSKDDAPLSMDAGSTVMAVAPSDASGPETKRALPGLGAPIAAASMGRGEVVVAAFDATRGTIRLQRFDAKDTIVAEKVAFENVAWSAEADLKVTASSRAVSVVWRGLREGKLVRVLARFGADLSPHGAPVEISPVACATRDTMWTIDGDQAVGRGWDLGALPGVDGSAPAAFEAGVRATDLVRVPLPKDKDASLLCGAQRAFAVIEDEERSSVLPLSPRGEVTALIRESDFGEDEQRELSEYTTGDDVGVVRLASSGALALREIASGAVGPLHRLKTKISRDADVVIVDASPRFVVIVYTEEPSESRDAEATEPGACTRVGAIRVDRMTFEESAIVLSPGRCGAEVGPFFTSAVGDAVSVAWPERSGGVGKARAPIVGLAYALVGPAEAPSLQRVEQPAEALVDATCDELACYAVALTRGADPASPGVARVIRYQGAARATTDAAADAP